MLTTDFSNKPYIAEVLRTSSAGAERAPGAIARLIEGKWTEERTPDETGDEIVIHHGFVASPIPYHRATRSLTSTEGGAIQIPRTKHIRGKEHYLYDLLVVGRGRHLVVAVPFHGLAANLFVKIDKVLAGTRTLYETLDITNMVIRLGLNGRIVLTGENGGGTEIVVTRCNLAYSDPVERRRDIEQVRLTGANLGASKIYGDLVHPVLERTDFDTIVTPILLGFALFRSGVRKTSATSDRHGNFKVSVGPGLRQVTRLFQLLDEIERMEDVVSTTSNVPILQSTPIDDVE
jgi:hypothetical protein